MAINPVSVPVQSGNAAAAKAVDKKNYSGENARNLVQTLYPDGANADVYEKSVQSDGKASTFYTRETVALNSINRQVEARFSGLRSIVENLLNMQMVKKGESEGLSYDQIMEKYQGNLKNFYQNLDVDNATRLKAQQDISEDGFWGVKQTSERIVNMAIALSGGDTSKLSVLKAAVEKGYAEAESAWGGALPEISSRTREAVMKGLDQWANGGNSAGGGTLLL